MESIMKFFGFLLFVAVVSMVFILVLIAPIIAIDVYFEKGRCEQFTAMHSNDFEFQWVFYGGCMVKTDSGRWVDASEYFQVELVP